ncbi:MAG: hypothetical protein KC417_15010 [Myxococcales bacterium]|nr:hypothetical protein [Myxococcales bacterium]
MTQHTIRFGSLLVLLGCSTFATAGCGGDGSSGSSNDGGHDASSDASTSDANVEADADVDAGCIPTNGGVEQCGDRIDNDCNGFVDDVDEGEDGLYDCLRIGIFGIAGLNASSNFNQWLTSNGLSVERVQTGTDEELTAATLADYDVVILDRLQRTYTEAEAGVLHDWVEAGGGVMSMTGYTGGSEDTDRPNSLLEALNLNYAGGLTSGPVTSFESHPSVSGITSVTFSGGFAVAAVNPNITSTVKVATLPNDSAAAMVSTVGNGRVFAWGDEWIEFDSEWTSMPEIPKFWAGVTAWLGHYR